MTSIPDKVRFLGHACVKLADENTWCCEKPGISIRVSFRNEGGFFASTIYLLNGVETPVEVEGSTLMEAEHSTRRRLHAQIQKANDLICSPSTQDFDIPHHQETLSFLGKELRLEKPDAKDYAVWTSSPEENLYITVSKDGEYREGDFVWSLTFEVDNKEDAKCTVHIDEVPDLSILENRVPQFLIEVQKHIFDLLAKKRATTDVLYCGKCQEVLERCICDRPK